LNGIKYGVTVILTCSGSSNSLSNWAGSRVCDYNLGGRGLFASWAGYGGDTFAVHALGHSNGRRSRVGDDLFEPISSQTRSWTLALLTLVVPCSYFVEVIGQVVTVVLRTHQ
jgi:hypothetical protein